MTADRHRRRRDESGVYAILYAALMLVMLGVAATVVDLALMREGRATTRSAADSAAVAGASALNAIDPSKADPRRACLKAWQYLREGLPDLGNGGGTCDALPVAATGGVCAGVTTAKVASWPSSRYLVRITWPVFDSSPLMTKPDVAPGTVTQAANASFDGTNPCDRIGVEVERTASTVFAGALGVGKVTIRSASVGRAIEKGESKDVIAALNILEQTKCAALDASGQGSVTVVGVGDQAGYVAVESSGRPTDNSCNGQETVIKASTPNQSTNQGFIRADGPTGEGTGLIQSYALNPSPVGNPTKAYNTAGVIKPTPTMLTERYGAKPVLDIFNCTGSTGACAPGGGAYITGLDAMYGGTVSPTAAWPASNALGGFRTLPSTELPGFSCTTQASDPPVVVPAGNWFVNCPGDLIVNSVVVFAGGHVVTSAGVDVRGGCLAVNVPVTAPVCPTANTAVTPDTTSPPPTGDAILFLRSGDLTKGAQAQLYLPQTFTFIKDGVTDLDGGSGALLMTTPLASSCPVTDDICKNRNFRRLVLWSERNDVHSIGGQSALVLRGVLFTPNAESRFAGQAGQNQADAQFWTRTLVLDGQGNLVMAADPEASVARPLLGVSLIR